MRKFAWLTIGLCLAVNGVSADTVAAQGRPVRSNWLSDGSRLIVGDVVTVLVDEYVLASADVQRTDARQRDTNQGMSGIAGIGLRTLNDATDRRRGENTRRDVLTAELTARIIEVSPDGRLMRVEGKKILKIDDHEQELILRGWVRPTDITSANTIASARLADSELLYTSNGVLGTPTVGMLARLLGFIF